MRRNLIVVGLLTWSQAAIAQQRPDAGQQIQQIPPSTTPLRQAPDIRVDKPSTTMMSDSGGSKIQVNRIQITGQTLFTEQQLIAATNFKPGSHLTLTDLRNIAAQITRFYNSRGYFLAQAYLPPQEIIGATVTVAIVEGRYGALTVNNQTSLSGRMTRGVLAGLAKGDTIAAAALERRLLLLSDIPGISVQSTLSPGLSTGTSDLMVNIMRGRLITGSLEADNAGNRFTGAYRSGGTLSFNNPTGQGDLLSLRALVSNSGLAYGRASYQRPLGAATVGLAFSHINYALGHEFESLDADGTADVASLFGSYPLVRSRATNLNALASAELKFFRDRLGAAGTENRRRAKVLYLGIGGNHQDHILGGGYTVFSIGTTLGELNIASDADRAIDQMTARSNGGYGKLQAGIARLQRITDSLSLYVAVRGQLASKNLDSAEKMQLGGAYAVRAYPEGEAYGDEGYVATAEARYLLPQFLPVPGQFQLFGFADVGAVHFSKNPWFPGSNVAHRSGIGAGLAWAGPHGFLVKGSYAHKLGNEPVTSDRDRDGRFWFQITKLF